MTHQIIEVRDPNVFETDECRAFFQRAFVTGRPMQPQLALDVSRALCLVQRSVILMGLEDGEWRGLLMGTLPVSPIAPHPNVFFLYNAGSAEMRKALIQQAIDWMHANGYTEATATNWSPHSDEAWLRLWGDLGNVQKQASTFLFSIPRKDEEPANEAA